jgi:hypothetical protein
LARLVINPTTAISCPRVAVAQLSVPYHLLSKGIPPASAALCGLRLRDQPRTLWADAICINQQCTAEKEAQVQLMRDIFSHAERTLIWLGTLQDKHEERISLVATAGLEIGLAGIRFLTRSHVMPSVGARYIRDVDGRGRTMEPFSPEFYFALLRLLRRPWFQHAWAVQELWFQSSRCYCGICASIAGRMWCVH